MVPTLQGHMLVFVKRYKQLYLGRSSERVCTSDGRGVGNFQTQVNASLAREMVRQVSFAAPRPRPAAVETRSELSVRVGDAAIIII